eukprot:SAG31_NODE_90_length_26410_cov_175.663981_28_plen_175_part_00
MTYQYPISISHISYQYMAPWPAAASSAAATIASASAGVAARGFSISTAGRHALSRSAPGFSSVRICGRFRSGATSQHKNREKVNSRFLSVRICGRFRSAAKSQHKNREKVNSRFLSVRIYGRFRSAAKSQHKNREKVKTPLTVFAEPDRLEHQGRVGHRGGADVHLQGNRCLLD